MDLKQYTDPGMDSELWEYVCSIQVFLDQALNAHGHIRKIMAPERSGEVPHFLVVLYHKQYDRLAIKEPLCLEKLTLASSYPGFAESFFTKKVHKEMAATVKALANRGYLVKVLLISTIEESLALELIPKQAAFDQIT